MSPTKAAEQPPATGALLWQLLLRRGAVVVRTFDAPPTPGGRPVLVAATTLLPGGTVILKIDRRILARTDLMARHARRVEAQHRAMADSLRQAHHILRWMPWLATGLVALGGGGTAAGVAGMTGALEHMAAASCATAAAVGLGGAAFRHTLRGFVRRRILRMAAPQG